MNRVVLDGPEFFGIQLAGFFQDEVRDGHLAQIVQHGGNSQQVFVALDFVVGNTLLEGPLMVDLRRIGADPVGMHSRFLGVPQFAHLDHPHDDLPGHNGAFNRGGGVIGKVLKQKQVPGGKGRGLPVVIQRIDNL